MSQELKNDSGAARKLLQSGIIFSAISFLTGLGNLAFQSVMGHHLKAEGQYGNANSAISGFMPLLGLLPLSVTFAVTHYIAHFNTSGDDARLQGLLLGCRKFLFRLTVAGSLLAAGIQFREARRKQNDGTPEAEGHRTRNFLAEAELWRNTEAIKSLVVVFPFEPPTAMTGRTKSRR